MYLGTHGNWVGLARDSTVGTGGTHFLACQCSKLRTRKASLTWMHKDEEMFNLYVSLQQTVTCMSLCLAPKASDGGNTQQQVNCVGHILPGGKQAT